MKVTEKQLRNIISESIKNALKEEFDWNKWDKKSDSEKEDEIDKIIKTHNDYRDGKCKVNNGKGKKVPWKRNSERCLWTKHDNPNGSDEEREVYNKLKSMPLKQAVAESVDKAFNKVLNEMHYHDFKALGQGGDLSDYTEVLKRYQFSPDIDFENIDVNQFNNISKGSNAFYYISVLTPDGKMWQSNITTRSERKAFHMAERITDELQKTNWIDALNSAGLLKSDIGLSFADIAYIEGVYQYKGKIDTDTCGGFDYDFQEGYGFWND